MPFKPKKAFILAAGKGTRLRPHTDTMPKPMVPIAGRSIILRALEKLAAEGVDEVVINLHHLAPVLKDHLKGVNVPKIIFSSEEGLLETGGGLKKAIHHFEDEPFYIINGDALWDEGMGATALDRLASLWDSNKMDILLLLEPKDKMILTDFVGDYHLRTDGSVERSRDKGGNYMFAGIRIAHPKIFVGAPDGAFSFLQLMDTAEQQGRLFGTPHNAEWYHISTPKDLSAVDASFRRRGDV